MMSETTLDSKLEALHCHFTWDLEISKPILLHYKDKLEDIGTEEGNSWLGHIYNLRGFVQYKLGFTEDAQSFFNKAAEAFSKIRNADEGPWLVVNYGNLAWLHHHLGDQAESQAYLSKVNTLMNKYPSPSQDELHPEIYAEKGWTLLNFKFVKILAADYFQRAIRMQPGMVEWNSSHARALVYATDYTEQEADILEIMKIAKEQDPENVYLAAHYLTLRADRGEEIKDEARELARKVLQKPVGLYSGVRPLLQLYSTYVSMDEAIALAEEALGKHPHERYLKKCVALLYQWKIFRESRPDQGLIDRAIILLEEVISLYPHSSFFRKTDLAEIYAMSNHSQDKAEQIYLEMLERDLEPADKQMVYNCYAKYLNCNQQDYQRSIQYNMKVAAIPVQSPYRCNSIATLKKMKDKGHMCREIEEFLENLQEP
ncbi:interferon-induced protein with tetratricopeptide repeats 2-like [Perca flavescens]|uniref:interferon-induced protein with tetratricopeptide repeats 2-like n=1 Tax=Perca flavescens TaxID=8167 RepID=UPI00106E733D|nr:interferon-induced protein with tetratricopeptide repeats 2-like [Perca flavescens]